MRLLWAVNRKVPEAAPCTGWPQPKAVWGRRLGDGGPWADNVGGFGPRTDVGDLGSRHCAPLSHPESQMELGGGLPSLPGQRASWAEGLTL